MERLLHFLHFKKSEPSINKTEIETPKAISEKNIVSGSKLLDELKVKDKLLAICQQKFGPGDYLVCNQINDQNNPDTDEDTDPWVSYAIKKNNNSEYLLKIGVLVGNFHGMSNQIYISEERGEKGKDYFKHATVLLGVENQEVFELQPNGKHQTTEDWINEKLESFINPLK